MNGPIASATAETDLGRHPFWTVDVLPGPLLFGAGVQSAALGLAAGGWSPAAWQPAERFATGEWIIAQWVVLSLFLPYLLPNAGTTAAAVLLIWPGGVLASVLAGSSRGVTAASIYLSVWVAALAIGLSSCRTAEFRRAFEDGVRMVVLGGALLAYLAADQFPPAAHAQSVSHLDPCLATIRLLNGDSKLTSPETVVPLAILVGLIGVSSPRRKLLDPKSILGRSG